MTSHTARRGRSKCFVRQANSIEPRPQRPGGSALLFAPSAFRNGLVGNQSKSLVASYVWTARCADEAQSNRSVGAFGDVESAAARSKLGGSTVLPPLLEISQIIISKTSIYVSAEKKRQTAQLEHLATLRLQRLGVSWG